MAIDIGHWFRKPIYGHALMLLFAVGFVTKVGFNHILMVLISLTIILLSLLLAGCSSSSPQIPNIFLTSFYYQKSSPDFNFAQVDPGVVTAIANIAGGENLEVRVGYFGICIQPNGGSFICNANATALAEVVNADQDPLNLIWVASTFKDAVVFPYLIIIAIILQFFSFILFATFPGWHDELRDDSEIEVRPIPSRWVSQTALALIFISAVFVLVSVLWQHAASVAASTIAQAMGNGSVLSGVGASAMILGWFGFGFLVVVTVGSLIIVISIRAITELADADDLHTPDD